MASTRRPPMDSVPMMVCTHSYRMAFPALRVPSVLVATWPHRTSVSHVHPYSSCCHHSRGTCQRQASITSRAVHTHLLS